MSFRNTVNKINKSNFSYNSKANTVIKITIINNLAVQLVYFLFGVMGTCHKGSLQTF